MSRATVKAEAKDMATFQKKLLTRAVSVWLLLGAALLFGGAAFSPGIVHLTSPVNPAAIRLETDLSGSESSHDAAQKVGGHSAVLKQLDEALLTERAVSTAV